MNTAQKQQIEALKAENEKLKRHLKLFGGCDACAYSGLKVNQEPCYSCFCLKELPYWKWRGEAND